MRHGRYMLDEEGNPKPEPDLLKWAMWYEYSHQSKGKDNRILQQDHIGGIFISTIFLGLDHSFGVGPPILWETMIFRGKDVQWMRRYRTRAQAVRGHKKAVKMVVKSQPDLRELERMAAAGGWSKKYNA